MSGKRTLYANRKALVFGLAAFAPLLGAAPALAVQPRIVELWLCVKRLETLVWDRLRDTEFCVLESFPYPPRNQRG